MLLHEVRCKLIVNVDLLVAVYDSKAGEKLSRQVFIMSYLLVEYARIFKFR